MRPIKMIAVADMVTDCIPVLSSVKSIGIGLYQRAYKVDTAANPVKYSVKHDIIVHVLSKDAFMTTIAMIPALGNLACLILYCTGSRPMGDSGYLKAARHEYRWAKEENDEEKAAYYHEIVRLYLARNAEHPEKTESKLANALARAIDAQPIFELILNAKASWSPDSIVEVLKLGGVSQEMVELMLSKSSPPLTKEQAGDIVQHLARCFSYDNCDVIALLLEKFPNIDSEAIGKSLEQAADGARPRTYRVVELLLTRLPEIEEKYLFAALTNAAKHDRRDLMSLFLARSRSEERASATLTLLLEKVAFRYSCWGTLDWLLKEYASIEINLEQAGTVLSAAIKTVRFGDEHQPFICTWFEKYPDLIATHITPLLKQLAFYCNVKSFEFFLLKYQNNVTPSQVGLVIAEAFSSGFVRKLNGGALIDKLIADTLNLAGEGLDLLLKQVASHYDSCDAMDWLTRWANYFSCPCPCPCPCPN